MSQIYLAGGCFWGMEKYIASIHGVEATEVGYANGATENPTYEDVCHKNTGHVHIAHFDVLSDAFDNLLGFRGGSFVGRSDIHAAIVFDVDFHAGFGNDFVNHLATRSNNLANLFGVNGKADNLGREFAQFLM